MIGYIYASAALLAGLTKGFYGKKAGNVTHNVYDGIYITFLRMVFCAIIGAAVVICSGGQLESSGKSLLICILSAAVMAVFNVSWLMAVGNESYMFISVATMLGSMCAAVASSVLFSETLRAGQAVGMALLAVSVTLMYGYNTALKGRMKLPQLITLAVCGISSGAVDFTQKFYMKTVGTDARTYNLYTYVFSALILLAVWMFIRKRSPERQAGTDTKKVLVYVLTMSVCLYINSLFKTLAAGVMPAAVLYPMLQGANLILSSAMAWIFFNEKISAKGFLGIAVAVAAMLLINS